MVSFIKKIKEKSKELKEVSKIYYNAANNLFKYINENNKKNITNTDKKIKEINKQIASIDDKIESVIKTFYDEKNEETKRKVFLESLETIQKNIKKIGFTEKNDCLENFLISKKLISNAEEIKAQDTNNKLQIEINKKKLGTEKGDLKIKFKEGGEYDGTDSSVEFDPSKGILEVLIEGKETSKFTSVDNFGIYFLLKNTYGSLKSKIDNINIGITNFCQTINNFINYIKNDIDKINNSEYSKEYSIEELFDGCFNPEIRWPGYKKLEDSSEKQKIDNYLNALLDELKSLNSDIIEAEDVKIPNIGDVKTTDCENFSIDENNNINIDFQKIFDVNNTRNFGENATFSKIEGIAKLSYISSNREIIIIIIPNIFFKKYFSEYSLEEIAKELNLIITNIVDTNIG